MVLPTVRRRATRLRSMPLFRDVDAGLLSPCEAFVIANEIVDGTRIRASARVGDVSLVPPKYSAEHSRRVVAHAIGVVLTRGAAANYGLTKVLAVGGLATPGIVAVGKRVDCIGHVDPIEQRSRRLPRFSSVRQFCLDSHERCP